MKLKNKGSVSNLPKKRVSRGCFIGILMLSLIVVLINPLLQGVNAASLVPVQSNVSYQVSYSDKFELLTVFNGRLSNESRIDNHLSFAPQGDFDGDGLTDLAIQHTGYKNDYEHRYRGLQNLSLKFVKGRSDLPFGDLSNEPEIKGVTEYYQSIDHAFFADLSDAPTSELVVHGYSITNTSELRIFQGTENLEFTSVFNYSFSRFWIVSFVEGDFDGDGYLDLGFHFQSAPTYSESDKMVFVLFGGTSPSDFQVKNIPYATQVNRLTFMNSMGFGDLDGDGFDDLIVELSSADKFLYYPGNPERSFSEYKLVGHPLGWVSGFGRSLGVVGDVNKDGYEDLVVGNENSPYTFILFYGGPREDLFSNWVSLRDMDEHYPDNHPVYGIDLDKNGYSDIIIPINYETINLTPDSPTPTQNPGTGAIHVYLNDENGLNGPYYLTGTELYEFDEKEEYIPESQWFGQTVVITPDLNGDGYPEFIAECYNTTLSDRFPVSNWYVFTIAARQTSEPPTTTKETRNSVNLTSIFLAVLITLLVRKNWKTEH